MVLNPATPDLFAGLLPEDRFAPVAPRYLEEPRGWFNGTGGCLACPRNVEEVATLIRAAGKARVPVLPYGGGTGLVGGQVMPDGPAPLILSLEKMAAVRDVFPDENVVIAEAGVILTDLQAAAQEAGRLFPLSLASEGSARVGGLLATNAGGTGVLRYGSMRDLCLGLEAVLPDGSIWNGLTRLRKDNTGYDLRNLLVGSEGTLGVVTAAALKLYPQPRAEGTACIVVPSPEAALKLLTLARGMLGDAVSAFELIGGQGLGFLAETLPDVRRPFDPAPDWFVLIEVGIADTRDVRDVLTELFEAGLEEGCVTDGIIAQSEAQRQAFWNVREHLPEANRRIGSISSQDISVPLGAIPTFVSEGQKRVAQFGAFRINCFGHVGDGNLHYNVFPPKGEKRDAYLHLQKEVSGALYDLAHELGGSISAEHGIGRLKAGVLDRYTDPTRLAAMRAIKAALDPIGIMNPGAVLS